MVDGMATALDFPNNCTTNVYTLVRLSLGAPATVY